MKSANILGMVLGVVMIAALGSTPEAYAAVQSNHRGDFCQHYYPADATVIGYTASAGAYSSKSTATYIQCPLVRGTTNSYGGKVYVYLYHTTSITTSCTFFSYKDDGTALGSAAGSWTGSGNYTMEMSLGTNMSNSTSNYHVRCYLPGAYSAYIRGINLVEY
jgi:hypothetical protein